MKKPGIYARILLVISLTGIIYFILLTILVIFNRKQEKLITDSSNEQFGQMVSSLLAMNHESLQQVIYDYTFWDEFVDAIHTHDTVWYNDYITTALASFRLNYIAVYDTSFRLTHEASSEGLDLHDIIPKEALIRLKKSLFMDFYIRTEQGLAEISCATVHTNIDPDHTKTAPQGLFVVARLWDRELLDHLSDLSVSEVHLSEGATDTITRESYSVSISKPLEGWDNSPESYIVFNREIRGLKLYQKTSAEAILLIVLFVVAAWLIIRITIGIWVIRPLKLVSGILSTEDQAYIAKLQKSPGEFHKIGQLFDAYVRQKKELKQAKERAEMSDSLKTEFLHNMTHEIRTPINGIMGFSNLLKRKDLEKDEKDEFIKIIQSNSIQLMRIIDDILEISKLETKQVRLVNAETNIHSLLAELFAIFRMKTEEKNIDLILRDELDSKVNTTLVDDSKLLKILNNLVENAIKFTERGFVEIGCHYEDDRIHFSVKDTGIGIDKENLAKIFDRFSQESETVARNFGGLGLGLSIARENTRLLGGQLSVESGKGVGSVFSFSIPYIPVNEQEDQPNVLPTKPESVNSLVSAALILIAEDNPDNMLYFDTLLGKMFPALKIIRAENGKKAVEICKSEPRIQLVLMDIKMPEMNGYEATRIIKQHRPDLPVVIQTAYTTREEKHVAFESGCDEYITKPITDETLREIINKYIGNLVTI